MSTVTITSDEEYIAFMKKEALKQNTAQIIFDPKLFPELYYRAGDSFCSDCTNLQIVRGFSLNNIKIIYNSFFSNCPLLREFDPPLDFSKLHTIGNNFFINNISFPTLEMNCPLLLSIGSRFLNYFNCPVAKLNFENLEIVENGFICNVDIFDEFEINIKNVLFFEEEYFEDLKCDSMTATLGYKFDLNKISRLPIINCTLNLNQGVNETPDDFFRENFFVRELYINAPTLMYIKGQFCRNCRSLSTLRIVAPQLRRIDDQFCFRCSQIQSLDLSLPNLTRIQSYFCVYCYGLKEVKFNFPKLIYISDNFLANEIQRFASLIAEQVGDIDIAALREEFYSNSNKIQTVDLSASKLLREIGDDFLKKNFYLQSVIIDFTNVERIGDNFCAGCINLASIDLSTLNTTVVGDNFLRGTNALRTITLPDNPEIYEQIEDDKSFNYNRLLNLIDNSLIRPDFEILVGGNRYSFNEYGIFSEDLPGSTALDLINFRGRENTPPSILSNGLETDCASKPNAMSQCYDILEISDKNINEYLAAKKDNLIFVILPRIGDAISYYCYSREIVQRDLSYRNIFYECTRYNYDSSTPYVNVRLPTKFLVKMNNYQQIMENPLQRIFYFKFSKIIERTQSKQSLIYNDIVSSNHCQAGSNQDVYDMFICVDKSGSGAASGSKRKRAEEIDEDETARATKRVRSEADFIEEEIEKLGIPPRYILEYDRLRSNPTTQVANLENATEEAYKYFPKDEEKRKAYIYQRMRKPGEEIDEDETTRATADLILEEFKKLEIPPQYREEYIRLRSDPRTQVASEDIAIEEANKYFPGDSYENTRKRLSYYYIRTRKPGETVDESYMDEEEETEEETKEDSEEGEFKDDL